MNIPFQISLVPRRQLFLNRNIRKFKLRNTLAKPDASVTTTALVSESATANIQEQSKVASEDVNMEIQTTVETTCNVTNETVTTTSNDASTVTSTTTTTTLDTTSTAAKTSTTVTAVAAKDNGEARLKTNGSSAPSESSDAAGKSRPLERVGAGSDDDFFIDDRSEININFQKYRMVFVVNKDAVFYKKNAFRQAKQVSDRAIPATFGHFFSSDTFTPQTHAAVTKSMSKKFHKFTSKWCDQYVTEAMRTQCNDWFMGRHPDLVSNKTIKIEGNDLTKTPYAPFNRYKVDRSNKS